MVNNKIYTGREIAIFTDAHALLEPTKAILEDIRHRGIKEIYSLGDNIGEGPNPVEVLELLEQYNVRSLAGNAEEYVTLGNKPFASYMYGDKKRNQLWTLSKLNEKQIRQIKLFPRSIELLVGGKSIGLCHFANDVRIDFTVRNTFSYQKNFDKITGTRNNLSSNKQFLYTNSQEQLEEIETLIKYYGPQDPRVKGYLSAQDEPLFARKRLQLFDAIIQGHVHWKLYDESKNGTSFYSIRAVGIAYRNDPVETASYVLLREHEHGFDMEEILVTYDREKMVYNILNCDNLYSKIGLFAAITPQEIENNKRR